MSLERDAHSRATGSASVLMAYILARNLGLAEAIGMSLTNGS